MRSNFQIKGKDVDKIEKFIEQTQCEEIINALNKEINFFIGEYYSNTEKPLVVFKNNAIWIYYLIKQGRILGNNMQLNGAFKRLDSNADDKTSLVVDKLEFNYNTCNVKGSILNDGKTIVNFCMIDNVSLLFSLML